MVTVPLQTHACCEIAWADKNDIKNTLSPSDPLTELLAQRHGFGSKTLAVLIVCRHEGGRSLRMEFSEHSMVYRPGRIIVR